LPKGGREEGQEQGIEIGQAKGRQEGHEQVLNLLSQGLSVEEIKQQLTQTTTG
jgi:predicted transposase YdaD